MFTFGFKLYMNSTTSPRTHRLGNQYIVIQRPIPLDRHGGVVYRQTKHCGTNVSWQLPRYPTCFVLPQFNLNAYFEDGYSSFFGDRSESPRQEQQIHTGTILC